MPKLTVRKVSLKSTRSYDRPAGIGGAALRPNGIGVVALAAINGKGAYRRHLAKQGKLARGKRTTRFEALRHTLSMRRGKRHVDDPRALAAWIGIRKYGPKKFQAMAAAGRKRAMRSNAPGKIASNSKKESKMARKKKGGWGSPRKVVKGAYRKATKRRARPFVKIHKRTHRTKSGRRSLTFRRARSVRGLEIKGKGQLWLLGRTKRGGVKGHRAGKFNRHVTVRGSGAGLRVFYKNRPKKGRGPINMARRAPGRNVPAAVTGVGGASIMAEDFMTRLRHEADPKKRLQMARAHWGKQYPYRGKKTIPTAFRTLYTDMIGGYRLGRAGKKTKRLTYGTGAKHPPMWALVGAPSPEYFAAFPGEFSAEVAAVKEMRGARKAVLQARAQKFMEGATRHINEVEDHGDMYTPNRRRRKARKGKRKLHGAAAKAHARKVARMRRKHGGSGRRRAKRRVHGRRRHHGRRRMRRNTGYMTANRRHKRRSHKRLHGNRRHKRRLHANRRRHGMFGRRLSRNFGFASLGPAFKAGLYVAGGFVAHRALSRLVSTMLLPKLTFLSSVSAYGAIISDVVVLAVGVPVAAKAMPARAVEIGSGMVAALIQDALTTVSQKFAPQAMTYLGDVPSVPITGWWASGSTARDSGVRGFGSYETMSGLGVAPYAQAAAGFGAYPIQASAGYGMTPQAGYGVAPYAQASAGYGLAEYEPTSGTTFDGIHGDQMSAERALNDADKMAYPVQASAGVGDIPSQSIWMPDQPAAAIHGLGAGIFGTTII